MLDKQMKLGWNATKSQMKWAFFACFVGGLLIHLYAFTNLIPNSDGIGRVYDLQQMTISGRWFLHYATAWNGFTQMPMVIGLVSLLFLALAAAFCVDILDVDSSTVAGLMGLTMAAFPCLGYTYLYLFTASAYTFAILLAVLSVWLVKRGGKFSFAIACLLLACAMGTYQAYACVAIALCLLAVFRTVLSEGAEFRKSLFKGLTYMAYLALGAILYYIILLIFLKVKDLELLSYLGMDAASSGYPFGQIPRLIFLSYVQAVAFFFVPSAADAYATIPLVGLNLVALVVGVLLYLPLAKGQWNRGVRWTIAVSLGLVALLPLGMNFGQLLSPSSTPTPIMKYAFVAIYLAVLLLADMALPLLDGRKLMVAIGAVLVWCSTLTLVHLNINNLLYTASAQAHRATESYATRLLTQIEGCEGYTAQTPVAIIGGFPTDIYYADVESYRAVDHYSVPIDTAIPLNKHIYYYLNDWLNVPIAEPAEEIMIAVSQTAEFMDMPCYPSEGSVAMIEGVVVAKIQEYYTPKSDFELAYENRR